MHKVRLAIKHGYHRLAQKQMVTKNGSRNLRFEGTKQAFSVEGNNGQKIKKKNCAHGCQLSPSPRL